MQGSCSEALWRRVKESVMSSKLIITIGREFGAEGHEIGNELAERIGFGLYDKDILPVESAGTAWKAIRRIVRMQKESV